MRKIILASASTYRGAQLQQLNVQFTQIPAAIDETPLNGELPSVLCERLSREKARRIAAEHIGIAVIGADQVVEVAGQILGKPRNVADAHEQLRLQSGQTVYFHSGCAVAMYGVNQALQLHSGYNTTRVIFKHLNDNQIDDYLQYEQPYDCAGSFKSESLGISLCNAIYSDDPSSLMGLPLILTSRLLAEINYNVI